MTFRDNRMQRPHINTVVHLFRITIPIIIAKTSHSSIVPLCTSIDISLSSSIHKRLKRLLAGKGYTLIWLRSDDSLCSAESSLPYSYCIQNLDLWPSRWQVLHCSSRPCKQLAMTWPPPRRSSNTGLESHVVWPLASVGWRASAIPDHPDRLDLVLFLLKLEHETLNSEIAIIK